MSDRPCLSLYECDRERFWCVLPSGHVGDHRYTHPSTEPPVSLRVDPAQPVLPGASFDELIGHLDDLIALARSEGFGLLAGELTRIGDGFVVHRRIYDASPADRAAAAREFASLGTRSRQR